MRKYKIISILTVIVYCMILLPEMCFASAGITLAYDSGNILPSSQEALDFFTPRNSDITVTGISSPPSAQIGITLRRISDMNTVFVSQTKSSSTGIFDFVFSTEDFDEGIYEIAVNMQSGKNSDKKYFKIAPKLAPSGAEDVFESFSVNGRTVAFDGSKTAYMKMSSDDLDNSPSIEVVTIDKNAKIEYTPSEIPKAPCAVKVRVLLTDGEEKIYNLILDEEAENRYVYDFYQAAGGKCIVEDNIMLGSSVSDASLVYSDRNNVYWSLNSSPIFSGATNIRRSKSDASGATNDNTDIAGAPKISTRPYYGGAYSGQNGEPYWMSFKVGADATVYMADTHRQGWPNNDGTWKNNSAYRISINGSNISGTNLYYKDVKAGETVNVPNYGLKEGWPEDNVQVWDPPAFAVVWKSNGELEKTDANLVNIKYSINDGEQMQIANFKPDCDTYTLYVPKDSEYIEFDAEKSDNDASISQNLTEKIMLEEGTIKKEIRVLSAGGTVEKVYTIKVIRRNSDVMYGDVDQNGAVNSTDAIWILRKSIDLSVPDYCDWSVADVDFDGAVNSTDAIWILRSSIGLSLPERVIIGS